MSTGLSESLDYEPHQSRAYLAALQGSTRRHFYGYTGRTVAKFISTLTAGVAIGLVAVALGSTTELLIWHKKYRLDIIFRAYGEHGMLLALAFHMVWVTMLVLIAAALVQFWAPKAGGGGVTLVMAFLNGNAVPDLLTPRTLAAKFAGVLCGCASGLAVGPEGPMVQLGACVASIVSSGQAACMRRLVSSGGRWAAWLLPAKSTTGEGDCEATPVGAVDADFDFSDFDHREFVSAGVAAGIAAAFGAPIGGVLFSMEEACSYWSRKVAWRCFLCAAVAAFTIIQVHPDSKAAMLSFEGIVSLRNEEWLWQAPFIVAVSLAAGCLGAVFNLQRKWLWRLRASRTRHALRLAEAVAVGVITVGVIFAVSLAAGTCVLKPDDWNEGAHPYGVSFGCEHGEYNDLATALLSRPPETIRRMFSLTNEMHNWRRCATDVPCNFTIKSLALLAVVYLHLMSLASGIAVPGGLFMPSIMVGGSFGAAAGLVLMENLPVEWNIQPGIYAIVGATAMLGGVFRSSISLVVIVVEGTRGIDFLFGVIIAVVASNWIAQHVHTEGVYESELERDSSVCFLLQEPPHALRPHTAATIMSSPVVGVSPVASVPRVVGLLRTTSHNGFPVLAPPEDLGDGSSSLGPDGRPRRGRRKRGPRRLLGMILRSQLLVLLERGAFCDAEGNYVGVDQQRPELERELEDEMRRDFKRHFSTRLARPRQIARTVLEHSLSSPGRFTTASGSSDSSAPLQNGFLTAASHGDGADQPLANGYHHGNEAGSQDNSLHGANSAVSDLQPDARTDSLQRIESGVDGPPAGLPRNGREPPVAASAFAAASLRTRSSTPKAASGEAMGLYLDLRPFLNCAPFAIRQECSAMRVHQVFVSLGLRHLCVVDAWNRAVGIITRKDLDKAAGSGSWRRNPVFASQDRQQTGWAGLRNLASRSYRSLVLSSSTDLPAGDSLPLFGDISTHEAACTDALCTDCCVVAHRWCACAGDHLSGDVTEPGHSAAQPASDTPKSDDIFRLH